MQLSGGDLLKIQQVLQGNDPAAIGTPGTTSTCTATVSVTKNGTLLLDDVSGPKCPGGAAASQVANLTVSATKTHRAYTSGTDYTFDATAHTLVWRQSSRSVSVSFDWTTAGTAGACGIHKADPNAVCLVASWQGAQVGGSRPGGGRDFGVRAIRLSD